MVIFNSDGVILLGVKVDCEGLNKWKAELIVSTLFITKI